MVLGWEWAGQADEGAGQAEEEWAGQAEEGAGHQGSEVTAG